MSNLGGQSRLKSGYSTGSHAAAALKGALHLFFTGEALNTCTVPLPERDPPGDPGKIPREGPISIQLDGAGLQTVAGHTVATAASRKGNNDDEDVTKGVLIRCMVASAKEPLLEFMNPTPHSPHIISAKPDHGGDRSAARPGLAADASDPDAPHLAVFAGRGVGVSTLPGLRASPGYPAINPGPLSVMEKIVREAISAHPDHPYAHTNLYTLFTIEDGESIALRTANGRVGIVGGLSLLGSGGIVKPLSSEAYLESIRMELSVARERGGEIFFVIGGPALRYVEFLSKGAAVNLIETGNFLYESLSLLSSFRLDTPLPRLTLVAGAGKMTRLAHGFRNTHKKFGDVDPASVLDFALEDPSIPDTNKTLFRRAPRHFATVRAVEEHLRDEDPRAADALMMTIARRGAATLHGWILELVREHGNLPIPELRTILLDSRERAYIWPLNMAEERPFTGK